MINEEIMMKCGHASNSTHNGKPFCCICECDEIEEKQIDLKGRKARCSSCGKEVDSNSNLEFFCHNENSDHDSFYCGCGGWD